MPRPGGTGPIPQWREQFARIERVRDDLAASYQAVARERASQQTPIRTTGPSPAPNPDRPQPELRSYRDAGEAPWLRVQQITDRLSEPSAAVLDVLDPRWRTRGFGQLSDLLDREGSALYARLLTAGGLAAARVGSPEQLPDGGVVLEPGSFPAPVPWPVPRSVGTVRPAGVGDLLIVQEQVLRYEESDVASIENVMRSERKQRLHRRLDRELDTTATTTSDSQQTERDLATTQRYDLSTEVERTLESQQSLTAGVATSASYGPVLSVEATADFATDTSSSSATQSSSSYAQEVVDTSVARLASSVTTRIVHTTLSEVEETNTHGFDNTGSAEHAVGIYRWVDKVVQSQVYNYGRRLFLEFVVPEPAAFYRHAQTAGRSAAVPSSPPTPLDEDFGFLDITPTSYQVWVDRYRVPDVSPPPVEFVVVAKVVEVPETVHRPDKNDYTIMLKTDSLSVPEGYVAVEAWVYGSWTAYDVPNVKLHVHLGRRIFDKDASANDDYLTLHDETGVLQIGVYSYEVAAALFSVEVRCQRTTEALLAWQLATYQKVVDTYAQQLSAYQAQVDSVANVQWAGNNDLAPDKKRAIERDELQKLSLVLLTDQNFDGHAAMVDDAPAFGYPEIDVDQAMAEGRYAQFMQQCFEWVNMTYTYYPYIWASKDEWITTSSTTDSDPGFESFLKAGAARVLVPVRRRYEKALLYYLSTGAIWNGGEPPVLDDPDYVAIVDEIAQAQGISLATAVAYGDPWTYSVPTDLVLLQDDSTLPSWEPPGESPT